MRAMFPVIALASLAGTGQAAEPIAHSFDMRFNLADEREVRVAATLPDRTAHRLQVEGTLVLELRITAPEWGGRWLEATLVDTTGGKDRKLALMDWPRRPDDAAQVQWLSFSLCGEQIIALRDAAPGRCADLPAMAQPDRLLGQCGATGTVCMGPYEGMPASIGAHGRIAPASEPGVPLSLEGRVLDGDRRPRAGVIVYAYQTDRNGVYPTAFPPRSNASHFHGRLRGWVRSDARGRYAFETIRPGGYGGNPEHVHLHVIEPGCASYIIDDVIFDDDPNYLRFTPAQRQSETSGRGGSGVTKLRRKGDGWVVTRDIHLGANIQGYAPCAG